ncbi:MAG: DUF4238 domain-containing protein [Proteobacteria bacterium]|nr:DUF4238 domain-containing protein [Pseudomonadota bacterium]
MSGRKQHYLPRFLQHPFAFKENGTRFYVYAHHRAHGSYPANAMNLGQELDFYSGPDDTSLDDAITVTEKSLAITVHRLNGGEKLSQAEIAQLVSALSIRTKAMRQALIGMMPAFLEAAHAHILDKKNSQKRLYDSLQKPATRKKAIDECICEKWPDLNREQRAQMRFHLLPKWKSFVENNKESLVAEMHDFATRIFDLMLDEAAPIADKAFINALTRGPDTPVRTERFAEEMQFDIWDVDGAGEFVLGDCGPVAVFTDGVARLALGTMDDDVEMEFVFLPVSPTKCIVGRRSQGNHGLSVDDLNRISAGLSHEFVVSRKMEGAPVAGLASLIGSMTPIASKEAIFQALNDDGGEMVA